MASPRVVRLADQIKVIVAEMLERRIKDPRLGFVTVTDVRLTGDTHDATVFYTVLGSEAEHAGTAAALRSATGLIRSQVGKQLGLKFTPTIEFVPDAVPENARHIDDLLAQARSVDARVAEQAAGAAYAGEADPYKHDEVVEERAHRDDDESSRPSRRDRPQVSPFSTSPPAGPHTRWLAAFAGWPARARWGTRARWTRWLPAC